MMAKTPDLGTAGGRESMRNGEHRPFGQSMKEKKRGVRRFVSKNTGPWSQKGEGPDHLIFKEKAGIVETMRRYKVDAAAFQEVGLHESRLTGTQATTARFTNSFERSHMTRAWNKDGGAVDQ